MAQKSEKEMKPKKRIHRKSAPYPALIENRTCFKIKNHLSDHQPRALGFKVP